MDLARDPDFEVTPAYEHGTGVLFVMNTSRPPLDDVRVRRALLYAYPTEDINTKVYDSKGLTLDGYLLPKVPCYWEEGEGSYDYDPEKAVALLEEAGWLINEETGMREKDGEPLVFEAYGMNTARVRQLELMASYFTAIGVEMKMSLVPYTVQAHRAQTGDFDFIYEHLGKPEPDVLYTMWHSENLRPGGWSWSRFVDQRLDAVLEESQVTSDQNVRCALFEEAQQILVDNALALYGVEDPTFYVTSNSVKGLRVIDPVGVRFLPGDMYIEE